jgi:hypothetical protein
MEGIENGTKDSFRVCIANGMKGSFHRLSQGWKFIGMFVAKLWYFAIVSKAPLNAPLQRTTVWK